MNRLSRLSFFWLLLAGTLLGAEVTGGAKYAGFRGLLGYRPQATTRLEDFPAAIAEKVTQHLKHRLGENFFTELEFTGGQIVDFEKLCQVSPRYLTRRAEIADYDVHFRFKRPDLGIVQYEAQIQLRTDGSIMKEADIPAFRTSPEKLKFLSFSEVKAIAAKAGVPGPIERAEMGYNQETDAIFWRLYERKSQGVGSTLYQTIQISAHDGAVVRKDEVTFRQ